VLDPKWPIREADLSARIGMGPSIPQDFDSLIKFTNQQCREHV